MMYPVETEKEYLRLRNTKRQQQLVARARLGDATAKQNLLQTNYSCLPDAEGRLKGSRRCSTSVGMDIDLDRTAEDYEERMKEVVEKVLGKREELGLLMLERSATKGYHMVFRRHEDKGDKLSGDLFISIDSVRENARLYDVDFQEELYRVIVHGLLHLIGYDDHTKAQKAQMRAKEDYYLSLREAMYGFA